MLVLKLKKGDRPSTFVKSGILQNIFTVLVNGYHDKYYNIYFSKVNINAWIQGIFPLTFLVICMLALRTLEPKVPIQRTWPINLFIFSFLFQWELYPNLI